MIRAVLLVGLLATVVGWCSVASADEYAGPALEEFDMLDYEVPEFLPCRVRGMAYACFTFDQVRRLELTRQAVANWHARAFDFYLVRVEDQRYLDLLEAQLGWYQEHWAYRSSREGLRTQREARRGRSDDEEQEITVPPDNHVTWWAWVTIVVAVLSATVSLVSAVIVVP